MPARSIRRGSTVVGSATPTAVPVYVDSDDNKLKMIPAGSGSTEVEVVDASSTQTLTNKTFTAPVFTNPIITSAPVAGGASLTLTAAAHGGKTILLDTAAGTTITLPAATGSGVKFRFLVSVTPTSNQHRINVVGNDAFFGTAILAQDAGDTVVMFATAADADQINLNGTTTGGIKGAVVELEDMIADGWFVKVVSDASGAEATPFATGQVS